MTRRDRVALALTVACAALGGPLGASPSQTPFGMAVVVDGAPVAEYAARGRIYVEALKGREFTVRLSNPTAGRVAVALSVDGRNVIDARRTTALEATKWILDPWQTVEIPGWQVSGEASRKFFFTETARSYAKWLGDASHVGTIEAVFYREKRRPRVSRDDAPGFAQDGAAAREEPAPPADDERGASRSPSTLASGESRKSRAKTESDTYAATGIGDKTSFPVQRVDFDEDPTPAGRVSVRYEFREQLVRLGVLPRPDDLFARDGARGFAHEYAPDPHR